jgi:hypothetical protein
MTEKGRAGCPQPAVPSTNFMNNPVIYSYTSSQAIADGFQVQVSKVAREAGITFPVFLTRAVYDNDVTVPAGVTG